MAAKPFPKAADIKSPTEVAPGEAVKAFTVLREGGGWVTRTYTIRGDQVVNVEASEPDLFVLAAEAFKLAAWRWWSGQR